MRNIKVHLQCMGTCRAGDKIWFVNGGFNGLFSLKLNDLSVRFEKKIPFLDSNAKWAYRNSCFSYEGRLFFFPADCKQILVYDVVSESVQQINIIPADGADFYGTVGVLPQKEQIWIFPGRVQQGVFILNLKTLQVSRDRELDGILAEINNIYSLVRINEDEIAISAENNMIIKVNIRKKIKTYSKQFEKDIEVLKIKFDGNNFWLLPLYSTDIYEWNQAKDQLIRYQTSETEWIIRKGGMPYHNMIFWKDEIIVLPCRMKNIMRIDRITHTISKVVDYPDNFKFLKNQFGISLAWPAFEAYDVIGDKILFYPLLGNMILVYDIKNHSIVGKELCVTSREVPGLEEIVSEGYRVNGMLYEVEDMGPEILDVVIDSYYGGCNQENGGNIGTSIYKTISERTVQ